MPAGLSEGHGGPWIIGVENSKWIEPREEGGEGKGGRGRKGESGDAGGGH